MTVLAAALARSVALGAGASVDVAGVVQDASIRELPARFASRDHGITQDRVAEFTIATPPAGGVPRGAVILCTRVPWAGTWTVLTIERSDAVCTVVRAKLTTRQTVAKGAQEVTP